MRKNAEGAAPAVVQDVRMAPSPGSPISAGQTSTRSRANAELIRRACAHLDAHADRRVTLEELGRHVGMSPAHLQRTFKAIVGASPREYAAARRAALLREGLAAGTGGVRAAFEAGFGSVSSAYAASAPFLGMTPATYARGGAGATIRYAIVDTALGRLLAARTERGLCSIALGDCDAELERGLRAEFHRAEVVRDDGGLGALCRLLAPLAGGRSELPEVELDVRATAFQWRVWRALREIPRGRTVSYGELACRIGRPSAARAVARACASNPVALVVPCHRVVRADGASGGYRWGAARKAELLRRESGAL